MIDPLATLLIKALVLRPNEFDAIRYHPLALNHSA